MRHVACAHAGRRMDENARDLFNGLERGICTNSNCGALRMFSGCCHRCRCSAPPRAIREGDRVPSNAAAPLADPARNARPRLEAELPDGALPEDFLGRVRRLPPTTIVHVPAAVRARHAACMAATVRGTVRGDARASALEQARSKLLLGAIPRQRSTRREIAARFTLWGEGRFAELLVRAEEQWHERMAARRCGRVGGAARLRARRARTLAREGAYRKAVVSLTSAVAEFDPEEQRRWAARLLPSSERPETASVAASATDPAEPGRVGAASAGAKAFEGVHFAPLSAPGPSGARPEHIRDAMAARPRHFSSQVAGAVAELHAAAAAGGLPECARWMLESRLVFLRKKTGPAPRPVRVGELWRRIIAKRLVHSTRAEAQALLLRFRQFGVAIPAGTDALIHIRSVLEDALCADAGPALAVLDLDLQNAFPSLEWDSIRAAIGEHLPALSPWVAWCHASPAPVQLPGGDWVQIDRGAEQGDPLGSLYCALVLADVLSRTRSRLATERAEQGATSASFWDAWFMDDGQLICEPSLVDPLLRILDDELAKVGATRGWRDPQSRSESGGDHLQTKVKSVARLVGCAAAVADCGDAWITGYVRATCNVPGECVAHVLGVDVGDGGARNAQFSEAALATKSVHDAIGTLGDSGIELVLLRSCASVCKMTHLLRASGNAIDSRSLESFDAQQDVALCTALCGPLHAEAAAQAALDALEGGLGIRKAKDVALPAFVASRVAARPLVAMLADALASEGFLPEAFWDGFEAPLQNAIRELGSQLSAPRRAELEDLVQEAASEADASLQDMMNQRVSARRALARQVDMSARAFGLVHPAGSEDPESDLGADGGLQRQLCRIMDAQRADALAASLASQERWPDVRRLSELRDPTVSHDWLWRLNPAHGPVVPSGEMATCVRVRLGAHLTEEPTLCERCGRSIVGRTAAHALCCAAPEGTHGHYMVRDALLPLVHLADPSACTEVPELIADAPALRPADIYSTAALPGSQAALDIGVCSPDAAGAGSDCVESMWVRKRDHYREHLETMESAGLRYLPIVVSCYGRVHPDSAATVERIAQQAARRVGVADCRPLLRRTWAAIGVAVWRRAASMARACLPRLSRESTAILFGEDAGSGCCTPGGEPAPSAVRRERLSR